ncbi:MAG TPA: HAD hydrolase family protein [Candidatus Thermoplasmatota archaeon]|nr:HAD hydrolase family protein [Candidatus Thermoplasmatota archaeon]
MSLPRALLTDLDRTLTDPTLALDARVIPRIEALERQGIAVAIVTGRPLHHVAKEGLLGVCSGVVAENGAILALPRRQEILVFGEAFRNEAQAALGPVGGLLRWERVLGTGPLRLEPFVRARLAATGFPARIVRNANEIMVLPPGIDKGSGARALLARLGIRPEDAVAIGDGANDVALFEAVGRSAAVANAELPAWEGATLRLHGAYADGFLELTALLAPEAPA